jgi:hypothetical protein
MLICSAFYECKCFIQRQSVLCGVVTTATEVLIINASVVHCGVVTTGTKVKSTRCSHITCIYALLYSFRT